MVTTGLTAGVVVVELSVLSPLGMLTGVASVGSPLGITTGLLLLIDLVHVRTLETLLFSTVGLIIKLFRVLLFFSSFYRFL